MRGERVQCLFFVAASRKPGSPGESSCTNSSIEGFALLPKSFEERHPEIVDVFSRSKIKILSNTQNDSSLQIVFKNLALEMFGMQIILRRSESAANVSNPLYIFVDNLNMDFVMSLFCGNAWVVFPQNEDRNPCSSVNCDEAMQDSPVNHLNIRYLHLKSGTRFISVDDEGSLEAVEGLLLHCRNIRYRHPKGGTILHFAAEKGMENLVKLLLQYGADVNTERWRDAMTPLHLAAMKGYVKVVEILIQHGGNVNAAVRFVDQTGCTPLVFAYENLHRQVAELLLESGADVNIVFDYCGIENTPLYSSSGERARGPVKAKATVLYLAVLKRDCKFTKSILHHQPDVTNEYNIRAFHFVLVDLKDDFKNIFEQMKQYGFTIDYDRFNNSVEVLCGAIHKNCIEVVRKMVDEGADVNKICSFGIDRFTPLHIAARHAGVDMIKLLLGQGVDVNVEFDNKFPIHAAVESNNMNAVKYFVANGINFPDKANLMLSAVRTVNTEMIKFFLLSGYPLIFKEEYNEAVGLAASTGRTEILELLFTHGAQLSSKWNFWKLLETAMFKGHSEILQTIFDHSLTYVQFADFTQIFRKLALYSILRSSGSYSHSGRCLSILAQHVLKLEAASLCPFKQNLVSFWHADESIDDFRNRCEMEIAEMKSVRVGDSQVVFYDFLTQNLNRLAGLARNDSIVKAMHDSDCCVKFPTYSSLLNRQFKKGLQRKELIEQGIKTCNVLFPEKRFYDLPSELKLKVIDFLSNCDLLVLNNILPTGTPSEGQTTIA